jgi:hypothetical protein
LLSVGYEVAGIGDGASKILTLWKSPTLINDTREGASEQTTHSLGQNVHDSEKEPCTSSKKTSVSLEKGSGKKVTIKDLVRKVHDFVCPLVLNFTIFRLWLCLAIFQNLGSSLIISSLQDRELPEGLCFESLYFRTLD